MVHLLKPDLGLLALSLNASIDLFDGNKAVGGNHLRWNFNPEMGFPKNGFTIQRYHIKAATIKFKHSHLDFASLMEWEKKINLPINRYQALDRIREVLVSQPVITKYNQVADDLMEVIALLTNSGNPEEMYNTFLDSEDIQANGLKNGLRVMDVLMTASVDPYIARMLGLYVIDTDADPTLEYIYLVQGHWDDMTFAPIHLSFEKYDINQGVLPLQFEGVKVIPNSRTIGVLTAERSQFYDAHILVVGNTNPGFLLQFEYPVEEVVIEYELHDNSSDWEFATLGEPLTYTDSGTLIQIVSANAPFQELSFKKIPSDRFRIYKISYRRKHGKIETVRSEIILDPSFTKTLAYPAITNLESGQMPAILDSQGEISNKISQVKISSLLSVPPINQVLIPKESDRINVLKVLDQLNNPVRVQFSRKTTSSGGNLTLRQLKKISTPAIYRDNVSDFGLPSLLGYWPLNANLSNIKDGMQASKLGDPQFVKSDAEDKTSLYHLKLNRKQAIVLENQNHLKVLGDNFTLQAKIKISDLCPRTATIIGNSKRNGFWWGIRKESSSQYRLHLSINNSSFKSIFLIKTNQTIEVSVTYDGNKIVFRNGGFDFLNFEAPVAASLGKVGIPRNNVCIGADVAITSGNISSSFIGEIAEISIWQQVIHPSESRYQLKKAAVYLPQQQDTAQLIFHDPKTYLTYKGADQITVSKTNPLKALASNFSIFLWARPLENMTEPNPTLLGNNYRTGFWLGLDKSDDQYRLRFYLNNQRFNATTTIEKNQWGHFGISYDGKTLKFFVNGKLDSNHRASLGPLSQNDLDIAIGSEILPTGSTNIRFPFSGLITGIQIWREALTIEEWHKKMGGVQLIDKFLENDIYEYGAQAIDLFGRISERSALKKIKTRAIPDYNPPVNLHTKFKPILGAITRVDDWMKTDDRGNTVIDDKGNPIKIGYSLVTNIPYHNVLERPLKGYDLTIKRSIRYKVPKKNPIKPPVPPIIMVEEDRIVDQSFEIDEASNTGATSFFKFNINAVPFEQLQPEINDFVSISFDFFYGLTWGWTGIQQLYFKEVRSFNLYQSVGIQNELSGSIEVQPPERDFEPKEFKVKIENNDLAFEVDELKDKNCLIGPHKFKIKSHTAGGDSEFRIEYKSEPLVSPKTGDILRITIPEGANGYKNFEDDMGPIIATIPVPVLRPISWSVDEEPTLEVMPTISEVDLKVDIDDITDPLIAERKNLIEQEKIDWFPVSKVYKITCSEFEPPTDYEQPAPKDYLPGAIVFYDKSEPQNKWRSFYVLWHQWTDDTTLVLYTTPGEKEEPIPEIVVSRSHPLRFYVGKHFNYDGELNTLPQFTSEKTTEQFHLALASADENGIQSNLSRSTIMVAVNRKRPAAAPRPNVTVGAKADYYGKSKITVDWSREAREETLFYKVFRATDSDIYTRDLEQRRTRQGFYKKMEPERVFQDDVDFTDWLQTQGTSITGLFPTVVDSPEWKAVTPIWRKWADRFYPSLIEDEHTKEISALGGRMGNEKAFKLLTGKPIRETRFIDEVNGIVNNRYYYRLKTMNQALSENTIWGPLSEAATTIAVKAPRKPVFTKVEAGDRQVTLHWSLNREPDFKEYILYRSENKADLTDLRWWSNEEDDRIVAKIADPRIKTVNNNLEIPSEFEIERILGVYRLDEFDKEASPIENQPQSLNYYTASSEFEISTDAIIAHDITRLRKIADGISVAVVYEDADGEIQYLVQQHELIPFIDDGLVGLRDYFYRLAGNSHEMIVSDGSLIVKARTLQLSKPERPSLVLTRYEHNEHIDKIDVEIINNRREVEYLLQFKSFEEQFWRTKDSWKNITESLTIFDEINTAETRMYRCMIREINNQVSNFSEVVTSNPRDSIFEKFTL